MNQQDRDTIIHNLVELVNQTNLDALLPKLLEKGVFTVEMLERYRNQNTELHERKRRFYLDLQRRGPYAFQHLISSLMATGHLDLAQLLQPDINPRQYFLDRDERPQNGHGTVPTNLPSYLLDDNNDLYPRLQTLALQNPQSVINLTTTPLKVIVKRAMERRDLVTGNGLQVYRMGSRPRGYFFMINNVEFVNDIEDVRTGAYVDEKNLEDLFTQLGFVVLKYSNQGLEDMKRKISDFAQRPDHKRYDCCVVAIMSHGRAEMTDQDTVIVAADGHTLKIAWVLEQFTNEKAPCLRAVPKIFFFQTCRGDKEDFGVKMTSGRVQRDGSSSLILRSMSDMLIGYSTLPGFKSNRDVYLGTWYIQAICEVFMEKACDTDIEDMLKMVDQKISALMSAQNTFQTSSYENRGFRKLYFNPGLYDEPAVPAGLPR